MLGEDWFKFKHKVMGVKEISRIDLMRTCSSGIYLERVLEMQMRSKHPRSPHLGYFMCYCFVCSHCSTSEIFI